VLDLLDGEDQRRAAESALRSSEERYRAVFEQAFEGIFTVAPSHAIIDVNESACRMLGYSREELLALHAHHVIHAEDFARVPIRFSSIPPGGVVLSERRFVRKDGSVMQGELSTKALLDGNFQVVVRDVTQRKEVQAQLLLADRLSSLGRLASGVAHEINNPLAYVMLNLEMLSGRLRNLTPGAAPEAIEQLLTGIDDARDGAERMRRIVRALSSFGRGDEERIGPVDVNGVLDSAIEIAAMQVRHRAKLVRRYDSVRPASANAFRLGQVFLNLLVNAADALPEGKADNEIVLSTRTREDGWILVEVRDNGAGIPLELQSRIFDPFFTTKAVGKGTGLGLAVCHAIVTSIDGKISCESAPGKGTLFQVALRPASEVPSASLQAASVVASPSHENVHGRVLIADDDARVAAALAAMLKMHEVVVVTGGRTALERSRAEEFDCIVCDVMMPEMTGIDVHEALGRDGRGMERRMVFVTGGAVTEATRSGLARVENQVLEKPVDGARLRNAVGATIAARRASG
jgi:PAS domain S-box-containing protein